MIETLVALHILVIALPGMASRQVRRLKTRTKSWNHTQAALLADDLIERGHADREHVSHYAVSAKNPLHCNKSFAMGNTDPTAENVIEWHNRVHTGFPEGMPLRSATT